MKRLLQCGMIFLTIMATTSASAQTLVAPSSASSTHGLGGNFGVNMTINGGGLTGNDINAVHDNVTNSSYSGKFWISTAGDPHPMTLTYNFATPTSMTGVAVWGASFVLPKQGHYTGDGGITCFNLQVDHAAGTSTFNNLPITPQTQTAQQYGFPTPLVNVTAIRLVSTADDRPSSGSDRNAYLSEFRGLTGVVNRPINTILPCGTTLDVTEPTDNTVTNDTTPTIAGTSAQIATISIIINDANGVPVQTLMPTIDGAGNWTIDAAQLPDGDYTVNVNGVTINGQPVSKPPINITIDTTPPSIAIVTPPDGGTTSDQTPTIAGTTEVGATLSVTISDANGVIQTLNPTVDAAGNWSIDAAQLPEGDYTISATATDAIGNTSNPVTSAFSVDLTPPALTVDTPANGTITNDDTPTIGGTVEPGATVSIMLNDVNGVVQTLNPTVDAAGNWSIDAAQLPDGDYAISATATDAAGNTSNPIVVQFTVDTTAPAIAITAPVNGLETNDTTPDISGTSEAGAMMLTVVISDANGVVQTLTPATTAAGNWQDTLAQLPEGDYTITATITDAAGNIGTTSSTFSVDVTAPTTTIAAPANGTTTNDQTPTISGTTEPGATLVVTVSDANGVVQTLTPTVDAAGNWTVDAAQLPEGDYTIGASATDAAGNVETPVTSTFSVDITPPAITLATPVDGTLTNDNTPTISGTVEPGAMVSVTVSDANGVIQTLTPTVDAQGNWTVDATQLPEGTFTAAAIAVDPSGNASAPVSASFTVDTTAPAVAITAPVDGTTSTDDTPTIAGTTEPGTTLSVTVSDANGVVQTLTPTVDAQGNWTVDAAQLPEGDYTITAVSTDPAGNAGSSTVSYTVDTTAPAIAVTTPADGSATNDDTPTISGTTEPGATVTVLLNDANGTVQTLTPTVDAQGNWTVDAAQLPEGDYSVNATATDAAGNTSTPVVNQFAIDTTAPMVAITAPTMDQVLATRDVDVTGTGEPSTDITVEIQDAGGNVVDTLNTTTDANGDWTVQSANLANGNYTVNATNTDAAGNTADAQQTFSVDSTEPNIQITAPVADSVLTEAKPEITGTADLDASVSVVIKDDQDNIVETLAATVDAQGNWTVTPTADLADGTYTIEATSTRPNGKTATDTVSFDVDATDPTTVITAPADGMVTNENQPNVTGTSEPGATVVVTITDDAGTVIQEETVTADANGDWSITSNDVLADGTYTIDATATDAAGNTADAQPVSFTVDANAPTVTITAPTAGQTITDSTPTISGIADPGATVEIFVDGVSVGEATAGADGTWTFDLPEDNALDAGDHTIEAKSTDGAGNEGSSGEITVTFDNPTAPVVITSPTPGEEVTGPDVVVTGTGEPGEEVTVTINGTDNTVIVDENGDWTITIKDVADGETTITAKSGDQEAVVVVNVATTKPDSQSFLVQGGGCSSTPAGPSGSIWLLGLVGLFFMRRRRRA